MKARALATRRPTAAELTAAAERGVAQRWEREPAAAVFPAVIGYTTDLQTKETATRLAIGTDHDCAAALDATLRQLAVKYDCAAGLRATYTDELRGSVYTVGVLAFPDASDAAAFYNKMPPDPYPATGLHALPVAGTAAALFSDKARQAATAQQAGPYVVLAVAGYADGRPAATADERRDSVFDPASQLISAVANPLAKPVTVRCGTAEWTCLAADTPAPQLTFGQIRPYEMTMLNQISVPEAWNVSKGKGVTVAVLDTGVDTSAPDIQGIVTTGPDYAAGADPAGYQPPHDHGTYISSIIAGRGDGPGNSQGIIGVAPESDILSVRVILDDGEPGMNAYNAQSRFANAVGNGIYYAVAHGAKVINMSLGGEQPNAYLRNAIGYAIRKGVVVVASAGNGGTGGGFAPYVYPASFSGVIAVAAVGNNGSRASFSEQNASVVIGAPGVWLMGDGPGGEYINGEGTSPAAAVISGVAALIKSRYPSLSPALVEQALIMSATHRPSGGYDVDTGFGEVDAAGALTAAARLAATAPAKGLAASARFAPASAAIQVTHRDMAQVTAYAVAGGLGALCALGALTLLVILARRKPRPAAVPNPSTWTPETWTFETWTREDPD
jgi:hypothetical protein